MIILLISQIDVNNLAGNLTFRDEEKVVVRDILRMLSNLCICFESNTKKLYVFRHSCLYSLYEILKNLPVIQSETEEHAE